jgi:chemotaxis protein methyltransferase CheR
MAIVFAEAGLLERTVIYGTDINPASLRAARTGVYAVHRVAAWSANYLAAGGRRSLSDYYTAAYGAVAFHRWLRDHVAFADHSLATDGVFAEVHFVSCRNVLIYFKPALQRRAVALFRDALVRRGALGLGMKESLRPLEQAHTFRDLVPEHRLYQRQ